MTVSSIQPKTKTVDQSIPEVLRELFLMLVFSSPHPAIAYADPTSIFDHWKWNEIRARRNLGEAN